MSLLSSFISNVMGQSESTKAGHDDGVNGGVDNNARVTGSSSTNSQNEDDSSNNDKMEETCREPLEWKFIDFTKAKRSPIFDVDPVMLKKFIGHNVTVCSISRQEFHGCCLAIDPVSLSVILAKRVTGGKIRVTTVPGYYLAKIRVDSNSVPAENSVSVNDLDVAELYHAPSLYSESKNANCPEGSNLIEGDNASTIKQSDSQGSQVSQSAPIIDSNEKTELSSPQQNVPVKYDETQILKRKESLMAVLAKHRMPVTVKEDILEIPGVKIRPPYTIESCETKNQMIKKKLVEILKSV